MQLINLLKQFLRGMNAVRKIMKKHFNKNLIMSEEEKQFIQVITAGFVKHSLIMTMKDIIVT